MDGVWVACLYSMFLLFRIGLVLGYRKRRALHIAISTRAALNNAMARALHAIGIGSVKLFSYPVNKEPKKKTHSSQPNLIDNCFPVMETLSSTQTQTP